MAGSNDVWDICDYFMDHLHWHKPRLVALGGRLKGFPTTTPLNHDVWPGSRACIPWLEGFGSARDFLFAPQSSVGSGGITPRFVRGLRCLSHANRALGLQEEGVQQAKEASGICERAERHIGPNALFG